MSEEKGVLDEIEDISRILAAIEVNHNKIDDKINQLDITIDKTIQMIEVLKSSIIFKLLECCRNIIEPGVIPPQEYASNLRNIKAELAKLKKLAIDVNTSSVNKDGKLQKTIDKAKGLVDIIKPFIKILENRNCDENCNEQDKIKELMTISEQIANVIYNEGVIIPKSNQGNQGNIEDIVTNVYEAIHLSNEFRNAIDAVILAVRSERNASPQRTNIFKNVITRYVLINFCIYLLSKSKLSYETVLQLIQSQNMGIGGNNPISEFTKEYFEKSNSNMGIIQLIAQYQNVPPAPAPAFRRGASFGGRRRRQRKSHKRPRKRTRGSKRAPPRKTRRYRSHK